MSIQSEISRITNQVSVQNNLIDEIASALEIEEFGSSSSSDIEVVATPLESNTTNLQAILDKVKDLPECPVMTGDTVSWDGDYSDKTYIDVGNNMLIVKISDIAPTLDDFANGFSFGFCLTPNYYGILDETMGASVAQYDENSLQIYWGAGAYGMVILIDNYDDLCQEKGIYTICFLSDGKPYNYITHLTINGYTEFPKGGSVSAEHIPSGVIAYVDNEKVVGTAPYVGIEGNQTITPSISDQVAAAAGSYVLNDITVSGDANLVSDNIKSGVSIFGVDGSYEPIKTCTLTIGGRVMGASTITYVLCGYSATIYKDGAVGIVNISPDPASPFGDVTIENVICGSHVVLISATVEPLASANDSEVCNVTTFDTVSYAVFKVGEDVTKCSVYLHERD